MKILKLAAGVALGRLAIDQVQKLRRPRRRTNVAGIVAVLGAGAAAYFIARELYLRREETPKWPSRKKLEREERQRAAKMRAQETHLPPTISVERDADTQLKTTLGDVAGDGLRR